MSVVSSLRSVIRFCVPLRVPADTGLFLGKGLIIRITRGFRAMGKDLFAVVITMLESVTFVISFVPVVTVLLVSLFLRISRAVTWAGPWERETWTAFLGTHLMGTEAETLRSTIVCVRKDANWTVCSETVLCGLAFSA